MVILLNIGLALAGAASLYAWAFSVRAHRTHDVELSKLAWHLWPLLIGGLVLVVPVWMLGTGAAADVPTSALGIIIAWLLILIAGAPFVRHGSDKAHHAEWLFFLSSVAAIILYMVWGGPWQNMFTVGTIGVWASCWCFARHSKTEMVRLQQAQPLFVWIFTAGMLIEIAKVML